MDIYAKKGHKVIFKYPDNGYTPDQEQAKKYLKVGETYTVNKTEVHSSTADVELIEIPGQYFNSVLFVDRTPSRFDYVKYDDYAMRGQALAKLHCEKIEAAIENLPPSDEKKRALVKLEECYMWIGKAIRNDQIARNGSAPLQEERTDS